MFRNNQLYYCNSKIEKNLTQIIWLMKLCSSSYFEGTTGESYITAALKFAGDWSTIASV